MIKTIKQRLEHPMVILIGGFLFIRLVLLMGLPYEGLIGYGDVRSYFYLAEIPGWPYLDHWSEYPPVFPFLIEILNRLAAAREHIFTYLLVFIFLTTDIGSLILFYQLACSVSGKSIGFRQTILFGIFLGALPYTWWSFDSLVVFSILLSIFLIQNKRPFLSGLSIGAGILLKVFPLLMIGFSIKKLSIQKTGVLTTVVIGIVLAAYLILWVFSPNFTLASLNSQSSKGSWQTIWALLDRNDQTGSFGPLIERLDPEKAYNPIQNPSVISPWVLLPIFIGIGFWRFIKIKPFSEKGQMALVGFTWGLFFLWMPGWSPQWIYYLLPFIILGLPMPLSTLFGAVLIFLNLLEWPILLSRGLFWALPFTVLLRTAVMILLTFTFEKQARLLGAIQDSEK